MKITAPRIGPLVFVMKWILLSLLLPAASMSSSEAQKQKLSDWMASYYRSHDLSRFDEFWSRSVGRGAFDADPAFRETLIGFLSPILHEHSELLKGRIDSVGQFPEKQRDAVRLLLWLIDTDSSRELLRRNGDSDMLAHSPPPVEDRIISSANDIDFCEGWFYATGDTSVLRPILKFVARSEWDKTDQRPDIGARALWQVCREDARARAFVEEFLETEKLNENARNALLFALGKVETVRLPRPTAVPGSPGKDQAGSGERK